MKRTPIRRGDIFWVDFDPSKGTEIQKRRPAIICSHDLMNEHSTRVIVAPITSNINRIYPFEYEIINHSDIQGKVMLDQIRSIDKSRIMGKISMLSFREMNDIESIIKLVLGIS